MGDLTKVGFIDTAKTLGWSSAIQVKWENAPLWKRVGMVAAVTIGLLVAGLILASPAGLAILPVGLPLFIAIGGVGGVAVGGLGITIALERYQSRHFRNDSVIQKMTKDQKTKKGRIKIV